MSSPAFSVIVPTFNRPSQVAACLKALASIDYDRRGFEVILVDDGGTCALEPVVSQFTGHLAVRLERQANSGPASARNLGASYAASEFLAFTDDDCEPDPQWLRALESGLRNHPRHAIGGRIINAATDDIFARAGQSILDSLYEYYNCAPNSRFFASNNIAIPAALFHDVGGFDPTFTFAAGEDREFCYRWLRQGYGLNYVPDAVVRHYHRMGLGEFWAVHFRYGRGAFQYRQKIWRQSQGASLEPLSFYRDILLRPFRQMSEGSKLPVAALVAVSQVAVLGGLCYQAALNSPDVTAATSARSAK